MLRYNELFSPFDLGPIRLKNRLILAPMITGLENNSDLSELISFYEGIAEDGAGLIVTCTTTVSQSGRTHKSSRPLSTSKDLANHQQLTKTLAKHNCKAILQLNHAGKNANIFFPINSVHAISNVTGRRCYRAPTWRLNAVIRGFVESAKFAIQAGYAGVEINASSESLIASFLSPVSNTRDDNWGGNQLGRFKLALDIISRIRKAIGPNYAIGFRFNLMELSPKGCEWSEILRLVQLLRYREVNYLAPCYGGPEERIPVHSHTTPAGVWNEACEELAKISELPVVFGHNFGELKEGNQLASIYENALFEIGKPFLADDRYIRKSLELVSGVIRPWIFQHESGQIFDLNRTNPLFSFTNPFLFNRYPKINETVKRSKKIWVIGAGISGLYFSLVAAKRGHQVTLIESTDRVGGQIHQIARAQRTDDYNNWIKFLETDVRNAGVEIRLQTKASINMIMQQRDIDHVILCTGSEPNLPDLPGIDSSNVLTSAHLLEDEQPVGHRVAVIGTNRIAIEVCRYLLENEAESDMSPECWRNAWGVGNPTEHAGGIKGFIPSIQPPERQVYLIESDPKQTERMLKEQHNRWDWSWIRMRGVQTFLDVNIEGMDNFAIRLSHGEHHHDRQALRIDHIVVCEGRTPLDDLEGTLKIAGYKVSKLGACKNTNGFANLYDCITDAIEYACTI